MSNDGVVLGGWQLIYANKQWVSSEAYDNQKKIIAEQLLTIQALNSALGGDGTCTTDNLVKVGRLEATITQLEEKLATDFPLLAKLLDEHNQLQLENAKMREALKFYAFKEHMSLDGTENGIVAMRALGETK